jgi:hypothetical protein
MASHVPLNDPPNPHYLFRVPTNLLLPGLLHSNTPKLELDRPREATSEEYHQCSQTAQKEQLNIEDSSHHAIVRFHPGDG